MGVFSCLFRVIITLASDKMYYVNLFALISMDLRDFVYIIGCLGLQSPATLWVSIHAPAWGATPPRHLPGGV